MRNKVILLLLLVVSINLVSAFTLDEILELGDELSGAEIPEAALSVVDNQNINLIISLDYDEELIVAAETNRGRFRGIYEEPWADDEVTMIARTDQAIIDRIIASDDPATEFFNALMNQEITYEGIGFWGGVRFFFINAFHSMYNFFQNEPVENECEYDSDCSNGNICEANVCVENEDECQNDNDCLSDMMICDDNDGSGKKCLGYDHYRCRSNSDCGLGLYCGDIDNSEEGYCFMRGSNPCISDDDCRLQDQGYVCRRRTADRNKYCRTKANDNNHCDRNEDCTSERCSNNRCVTPVDHCQSDSDCRDMMVCDDKGDGKNCYGYENYRCEGNNDCGTQLYCSDHDDAGLGYCYMRGSFPCTSNNDCRLQEQGYICRARSAESDNKFCRVHQRQNGYCETTEECADDMICRWDRCETEDQSDAEDTGVFMRVARFFGF